MIPLKVQLKGIKVVTLELTKKFKTALNKDQGPAKGKIKRDKESKKG